MLFLLNNVFFFNKYIFIFVFFWYHYYNRREDMERNYIDTSDFTKEEILDMAYLGILIKVKKREEDDMEFDSVDLAMIVTAI